MPNEIIVAIIGGAFTLAGVLISNSKVQGATQARIDELTREVREHNNFARRLPVVEEQIVTIKRDIAELKSAQQHN